MDLVATGSLPESLQLILPINTFSMSSEEILLHQSCISGKKNIA
jgi:hypothetical protein